MIDYIINGLNVFIANFHWFGVRACVCFAEPTELKDGNAYFFAHTVYCNAYEIQLFNICFGTRFIVFY